MRDVAMSEAVLLRHLHLALFSASVDQRFVSRHLCALWLAGGSDTPQKKLLARVVPPGLLAYLNMPPLSAAECANLDALEAEASEFAAYERRAADGKATSAGAMARLKERIADQV